MFLVSEGIFSHQIAAIEHLLKGLASQPVQ